MQDMLITNTAEFNKQYGDGGPKQNFYMTKVQFTNKYGKVQNEDGFFEFEGKWKTRLHSNEAKCFQGVQLKQETPTCDFYCKGKDCLLKSPSNARRMLVGADGRPDTSEPTPAEFQKRFL